MIYIEDAFSQEVQDTKKADKEIKELDQLIQDLDSGAGIWVGSDAANLRHMSGPMKKYLRHAIIQEVKFLRKVLLWKCIEKEMYHR